LWLELWARRRVSFGGGGAENGTNPVDGLVWIGSDSTGWMDLVGIWMIGMHRCLNIGVLFKPVKSFFFQRTYLDKLNPYESIWIEVYKLDPYSSGK